MPPAVLLATARDEVGRYGVEIVEDRVVDAASGFALRLAGGRALRARAVLLATGAVDELPEVAGARERWGRDLLHCPYCHGWEVRDRQIGVLGTGDGSVEHAHLLRQWSGDVILFAHTGDVTEDQRAGLAARGIRVIDGLVERLVVSDDHLEAVKLADGPCVSRDAVFIRPTLHAHLDGPAAALGCELREDGLVHTGSDGRTSVPGVWAAGNATNPRAQVITAAGEGSAVAIAINTEFVARDVAAAGECSPAPMPRRPAG
jgi:thioredoxin reductase